MDVNVVCRTCLKENVEMISIFCEDNSLSKMITACTLTTVSKLDGLPQQICKQCSENVQASYIFKGQSERAFSRLKEIFLFVDIDANNKADNVDACNATFGVEKSIQTDEKCFHPCEMCDSKFFNENDLKKHRKIHLRFICRVCCREYCRVQELKRHIAISHPNEGVSNLGPDYICEICNKVLRRNSSLRLHMLKLHNINLRNDLSSGKAVKEPECFNCTMCEKLFLTSAEYENHIQFCGKTNSSLPLKPSSTKMNKDRFDDDDDDDNFLNDKKYNALIGSTISDVFTSKPAQRSDVVPVELVQVDKVSHEDDNKGVPLLIDRNEQLKEIGLGSLVKTGVFEVVTVKSENISYSEENLAATELENQNIKQQNDTDDKHYFEQTKLMVNDKNRYGDKNKNSSVNDEHFNEAASQSSSQKKDASGKISTETALQKSKSSKTCPICNKSFTQSFYVKRHMRLHSKKNSYNCEVCNKIFNKIEYLNLHLFTHQDIKPFTCDICGKGYIIEAHLTRHKESQHWAGPIVKNVICDICSRDFATIGGLKNHMVTHIHKEQEYICDFCDKKCKSRRVFFSHLRCHSEKSYLCALCGNSFLDKYTLAGHMRRHNNEKPYKCKFCKKGFVTASERTKHERHHTGEKIHVCKTCGKLLATANSLLMHSRRHTGEKPHQCPHCDRSFLQSNDLKVHIRRHTGERFKCEVCSANFIQLYLLSKHKRTVHGMKIESRIGRVEKFIPSEINVPEEAV